jgi:protein gp37
MSNQTKIEWCDFTVNFWEGCQKVGPGCDHCYAEARDVRFTGGSHWGPQAPRRKVKGGIGKLGRINRQARAFHAEHGHWPRVFCSSLSDVFDNAVDRGWRYEAFAAINLCTNTRAILLTKRIGNVFAMIPPGWASPELFGWPSHVGLMITVVNQEEADRDIPKLLDLKARLGIPWVGLSMEPLLGTVTLKLNWLHDRFCLDWIIVGGESGRHARPSNPQWFRDIRDQCEAAGTPFLFKQWGEWVSVSEVEGPGQHHKFEDGRTARRTGKKLAGRTLDGRTWDQFPEALV